MHPLLARKWHHYHHHFHPHVGPFLLWFLFAVGSAYAGSITNASLTLGDPRPGATTTSYSFNLTLPSNNILKSFEAQVCVDAIGCAPPTGFSAIGATLASQPSGYGDASGWTNDSSINALRFKKSGNVAAPAGSQSIIFGNVTNPNTAGTYYVKITSFSDDTYSTPVDSATVAFNINSAVSVSLTIDPTLSFYVSGVPPSTIYKGTLATSDRCVDDPNTVTFGTPSLLLAPNTDYDCAQTLTSSTNESLGYQVTVRGVVPGDDLINNGNGALAVDDWIGTNGAPAPTPGGAAELFGYTTNDSTLSGAPSRFTDSDNLFAGITSADQEVAYSNFSITNDAVNVGYRLRFNFYSPSGIYAGRIIYTCTSTF